MSDPFPHNQDPLATRHTLLERVKDWNDHGSWKEFSHIYTPLILTMARKFRLSEEDAQNLIQDILLKVAKKLPDFDYDPAKGSFRNWLAPDHRLKLDLLGTEAETSLDHLTR